MKVFEHNLLQLCWVFPAVELPSDIPKLVKLSSKLVGKQLSTLVVMVTMDKLGAGSSFLCGGFSLDMILILSA